MASGKRKVCSQNLLARFRTYVLNRERVKSNFPMIAGGADSGNAMQLAISGVNQI